MCSFRQAEREQVLSLEWAAWGADFRRVNLEEASAISGPGGFTILGLKNLLYKTNQKCCTDVGPTEVGPTESNTLLEMPRYQSWVSENIHIFFLGKSYLKRRGYKAILV